MRPLRATKALVNAIGARTMHYANYTHVIAGDPVPVCLPRSKGQGRGTMTARSAASPDRHAIPSQQNREGRPARRHLVPIKCLTWAGSPGSIAVRRATPTSSRRAGPRDRKREHVASAGCSPCQPGAASSLRRRLRSVECPPQRAASSRGRSSPRGRAGRRGARGQPGRPDRGRAEGESRRGEQVVVRAPPLQAHREPGRGTPVQLVKRLPVPGRPAGPAAPRPPRPLDPSSPAHRIDGDGPWSSP
jgi:hypothetical protein